jgi:hypothetical protein
MTGHPPLSGGSARLETGDTTTRSHTMPPILSAIVLVIAVVAFAAIVIDTLRSGDRRGGLPAASFTYRAYGA